MVGMLWYEMSDATCSQDSGCGREFPAGMRRGSLKTDVQGIVHLPVVAQGFGTSVAARRCSPAVPWRQVVIFMEFRDEGIFKGKCKPGHNASLVSSI